MKVKHIYIYFIDWEMFCEYGGKMINDKEYLRLINQWIPCCSWRNEEKQMHLF